MRLLQVKTRGLGNTPETDWICLTPHLNLLHFDNTSDKDGFLHLLQTINPLYDCKSAAPFQELPLINGQDKHVRIITPRKRTISLAVFASTPEIVQDLSSISQLFYEVDRIEVGRRLDYSRWITFVELSSSTRWSEISDQVQRLLDRWPGFVPRDGNFRHEIEQMRPTTRVKGNMLIALKTWLKSLMSQIPQEHHSHLEQLLLVVGRADAISDARRFTAQRLPLFALFQERQQIASSQDGFNTIPLHLSMSSISDLINNLLLFFEKKIADGTTKFELVDKIQAELNNLEDFDSNLNWTWSNKSNRLDIASSNSGCEQSVCFSNRKTNIVTRFVVAASRVLCGHNPILLFNAPEDHLAARDHRDLAKFVESIAQQCQCLYVTNNKSFLFDNFASEPWLSSQQFMTKGVN